MINAADDRYWTVIEGDDAYFAMFDGDLYALHKAIFEPTIIPNVLVPVGEIGKLEGIRIVARIESES